METEIPKKTIIREKKKKIKNDWGEKSEEEETKIKDVARNKRKKEKKSEEKIDKEGSQ